jgi:hypothetical protein
LIKKNNISGFVNRDKSLVIHNFALPANQCYYPGNLTTCDRFFSVLSIIDNHSDDIPTLSGEAGDRGGEFLTDLVCAVSVTAAIIQTGDKKCFINVIFILKL